LGLISPIPVAAAALAVSALAACTFAPRLPEGKVSCATNADCPLELAVCRENACRRPAGDDASQGPDGTLDAPSEQPAGEVIADVSGLPDGDDSPPDIAPVDWLVCEPPVVTTLAQGLVAYLRLDDGPADPIITDSSPNGTAVRLVDLDPQTVWTTGRFGRALALPDGPAGHVSVGPPTKLNGIGPAVSVSAWIKFPGGAATDGTVVSRRAAGAGGYLYIVDIFGNRLRVRMFTSNPLHLDLSSNQPLPATTRWIHVAMTYIGSSSAPDAVRLFVDGKPFGIQNFPLPFNTENTPLLVGAAEAPTFDLPAKVVGDRLSALVDEVAVYQRALSFDEVKALACGRQPIP